MPTNQVMIYTKSIQFDVVLPENLVWAFAKAFGVRFGGEDADDPKTIDRYFFQGMEQVHTFVSVNVTKEQMFYDFLRSFCDEHNILMREEDLEPGCRIG